MKFKHLTVDDGLSQGWVNSICQDMYGFLWFATEDGLNRYDGVTFKVYKFNQRNKFSIYSSNISFLFEDSKNTLWIGTNQGLNNYDRQNDRFIQNPKWPQITVKAIAEDENNNLWIGTYAGLYYLDFKKDTVKLYTPKEYILDKGYLSSVVINSIFIDSEKNVWIGTPMGLNLYEKKTDSFINYYHDDNDPNSLSADIIRPILEDREGRLWIGTSAGLDLFINAKDHPGKGKFIHFQNKGTDQKSISKGLVNNLLEDNEHNLWISIQNGGLDLLDLNEFKKGNTNFIHFKNNPQNINSLSNNGVLSLFQDKHNNIWIGTSGKGIDMISALAKPFFHIINNPKDNNSLNNSLVNVFSEDGDYLWIGTEGGLNRYNKNDGTFKHFINDPLLPTSIGANAVWALCKDKTGNLWIGTWAGGLNLFDNKTETFSHFYYNPNNKKGISNNNIFSIIEDSKANLWIGTMGGGLNMYNPRDKIFTIYNQANSSIINNYCTSIIETKNGDIYIVMSNALHRFNATQKKFELFTHNINDSTSLSSSGVYSVFEDSKGNIWVGTDAGLNVLQKSNKGFMCYLTDHGLPSNSIKSILEDDHGNLWMGTNQGLSKFINAVNLPEYPKFKNYTIEDGLQSSEFRLRSCFKGADGMMYFGGVNGFNMFHPDSIKDNPIIPEVVITDFLLFNQPVEIGSKDSPLKKNISVTNELILKFNQTVLTFKYVALNYISPKRNQYAYMMEGFEKDWNYMGNKREATYTNLNPGKYIFKVKASNNDGIWNEKGSSIKIIILPPWWQTWWFRISFILLIIALLSGIYYYRIISLNRQKIYLESLVKKRTSEIEDKNKQLLEQTYLLNETNTLLEERQQFIEEQSEELHTQAEELNEKNHNLRTLNMTKDKFFSIIAHDLKNPFNAVLGFAELLSIKYEDLPDAKRKQYVDLISDSVKKIYKLLENLLQWARSQTGNIPYKPENFLLGEVINNNIELSANQLNEKKLKVIREIPVNIHVYADKNMINTVLRNLLTNAIKFSQNGDIRITVAKSDNLV
ncbi:MAG: two-component regulator propeller domain-containing protein, partial [Bacteroidales bacterium]